MRPRHEAGRELPSVLMTAHSRTQPSKGGAPHDDVVLSCRVRLARNIAGFPFVNRASQGQCTDLLGMTRPVLLNNELAPGMIWVDLNQSTIKDRRLLFERHLRS